MLEMTVSLTLLQNSEQARDPLIEYQWLTGTSAAELTTGARN